MTRNYTELSSLLFPPVLTPVGEPRSSVPFPVSVVNEQTWPMLPEPTMRIAMGFMAAKPLFVASAIGIFKQLREGLAAPHKFAQDRAF
jgi:hypothetical protein